MDGERLVVVLLMAVNGLGWFGRWNGGRIPAKVRRKKRLTSGRTWRSPRCFSA